MRGSPPLTRGIRVIDRTDAGDMGFIPAHAGNTFRPLRTLLRVRVHPRSRGEYGIELNDQFSGVGSSPLTRGIRTGEK